MASSLDEISNESLCEEIEAINAIYGSDVLIISPPTSTSPSAIPAKPPSFNDNSPSTPVTATPDPDPPIEYQILLQPPSQSISFLLSFPPDYPLTPPQVLATQSTGSLRKGEGHTALQILRDVIARTWTADAVCMFDVIEELGEALRGGEITFSREENDEGPRDDSAGMNRPLQANVSDSNDLAESSTAEQHPIQTEAELAWTVSSPLTEKKSLFIAHCARIDPGTDVSNAIASLLATNRRLAGATHNISAWRVRRDHAPNNKPTNSVSTSASASTPSPSSALGSAVTVQDFDDDGETAAGGRLLKLMQLMDVWNVVVVVSRWFGGVKLGPDRFRLINQVARESLVLGGVGRGGGAGKGGDKKMGRGRKS